MHRIILVMFTFNLCLSCGEGENGGVCEIDKDKGGEYEQ